MTKNEIVKKFESTSLLNIAAGKSTLPIEMAAEWTKGYALLNQVIYELSLDTHVEKFIDEVGDDRRKTYVNPQLLPFLQERRRAQEQIWKITGGEAAVEGQKQIMKNIADAIFHIGKDVKRREANKENIKKIIEIELNE